MEGEEMCTLPREKGWFRLVNRVRNLPGVVGDIIFMIFVCGPILNCAFASWYMAVAPSSWARRSRIRASCSVFSCEMLWKRSGRTEGNLDGAAETKNPPRGPEPSFS